MNPFTPITEFPDYSSSAINNLPQGSQFVVSETKRRAHQVLSQE